MPKRKTDKQFKQEVYDLVGNEYTFLDKYVNADTKIKVKHNKCGSIYEARPYAFLQGHGCPYCAGRIKKTDQQFKQEVYALAGNEYVFLEPYVNSYTKLKVKHNKCGNTYKVKPNSFLNGDRCPYCSRKARKTDVQFKQEVYASVGDEYTFLDNYVNSQTKLRVKHNKCKHIYTVTPGNFLKGKRCPYCYGNAKKTNKEFKQEVYDLVGNEYTFLDKYVNAGAKLRVKHNKCGNTYKVQPKAFLHGSRCPYCAGLVKKTDKQFKQEVYDLVGNDYIFIEHYQSAKTKIKVKHNVCGNVYEVTPSDFLSGRGCPYCFGGIKKTDTQFKQEIFDLVGNEYTFIDKYINNHTKLRVKHNECGNIYEVRPNDFLKGKRCPFCNVPRGELITTKILKTLGIDYEYQKTFPDLIDKAYLSYDFYVPSQSTLIEYQGIQHYQPIDYFGGDDQFTIQQKHDQMKLDYAKNHGYNLITVPYTEDTFSKIKKYLIKQGLKK